MADTRIEKDSLGEIEVPAGAYYGAQTERARRNFPVSGLRFPRRFIAALGADQGRGGGGQRGAGDRAGRASAEAIRRGRRGGRRGQARRRSSRSTSSRPAPAPRPT